jgi:alkyl hydroperoxide reductase subunit AhpC
VPALDSMVDRFAALNVQVMDISVDSITSHIAWQEREVGETHFPLCSDFYPHAAVTRAFGIFREGPPIPGISERAAFLVDKHGMIAFAKVYPLDQLPDFEEIYRAAEVLASRDSGNSSV